MSTYSITRRIAQWLAAAALVGFGFAMAAEPTLKEVYEAAHAGRVDEAQKMMQQVLVAHPDSAKAHFVQAELLAGRGQQAAAREALRTAEKLAPGLPFVKPEAVEALRSRLAARSPAATREPTGLGMATAQPVTERVASFPWGIVLLIGAGVVAVALFMRRRNAVAPLQAQAPLGGNPAGFPNAYPNPAAGVGPQGFQPGGVGYGQPQRSGIGGQIAGGLATGLAVGAGVMAAEAIGRNLMGGHDAANQHAGGVGNNFQPIPSESDLGGQNFGVADSGSWDDNAGSGIADSGDWDSN